MLETIAILLAGGAGERLYPLTRKTAKPAVPFGGIYRIIDFTLSNCLNSGLRRIYIFTQYKSLELQRHLREGWGFLAGEVGEFIEIIPPMKRVHEDWYLGTADAVFQNIESIEALAPRHVLILAADHIYKMNYTEMIQWHVRNEADLTIGTLQVAPEEASRFGIADIDPASYQIRGFVEKPRGPVASPSPFNPAMVSASMGIYVFRTAVLLEALRADAERADSTHDFGRDIIPRLLGDQRVVAYDFHDLNNKVVRYWRDVGTIDAYYEANMDLVAVSPEFNLYDHAWPMRTRMPQAPPAKFVFAQEGWRMGIATDSMVAPGAIVSGARVNRSILGPGVRVNSFSEVDRSILLDGVVVGRYCRIRNAIVDAGVSLPEGSILGEDPERDRQAGWHVSEGGVTVVSNAAARALTMTK
jgi:glucose-1-phosphate adenylyltransferase